MQIGQAAGGAAALAVREQVQPRQIRIRQLQQILLEAGCWLMPFVDLNPEDLDFQAIQRVLVRGWIRGSLEPRTRFTWANENRFYPDEPVSTADFLNGWNQATNTAESQIAGDWILRRDALHFAERFQKQNHLTVSDFNLEDFYVGVLDDPLTRREFAVLLDKISKSFQITVE
jgi:hypothetical protein